MQYEAPQANCFQGGCHVQAQICSCSRVLVRCEIRPHEQRRGNDRRQEAGRQSGGQPVVPKQYCAGDIGREVGRYLGRVDLMVEASLSKIH